MDPERRGIDYTNPATVATQSSGPGASAAADAAAAPSTYNSASDVQF